MSRISLLSPSELTRLIPAILTTLAAIFGASITHAASYQVGFLGDVGWDTSFSAINNHGQIVGSSGNHAALWHDGTKTDIGNFRGDAFNRANGINDRGDVVGSINTIEGSKALLWTDQGPTVLGSLGGSFGSLIGGDQTVATDINSSGQIIGSSNDIYGIIYPTIWRGTTPIKLAALAGGKPAYANSINDSGTIVGTGESADGLRHALIWSSENPTEVASLQGGLQSHASDINDLGQVVGEFEGLDHVWRPVLWDGSIPVELGALNGAPRSSGAVAINNFGQIVGASEVEGGLYHATIWNGLVATDLNALLAPGAMDQGWYLLSAVGINDAGSIIGIAANESWQVRYFLLTAALVPEPQTHALLLAGLGIFALRLWGQQRRSRP